MNVRIWIAAGLIGLPLVAGAQPKPKPTPAPQTPVVVTPAPLPDQKEAWEPGKTYRLDLPSPTRLSPANGKRPPALATGNSAIKAARAAPVGNNALPNGLRVLVVESPQEDMVSLELLVQVGLIDENAPVAGITGLIQEALGERISKGADGLDRVEASGSILKVTAEPDYARLSLTCTSEAFPELLKYLGEAYRRREFTAAELDPVRNRLTEALSDSPGAFGQLYDIFRQTFYRYHPYRAPAKGSGLALERMDPATVTAFFSKYYVPNRMVLAISGRVDRARVVDLVRQEFGAMKANDTREVEIAWEPKASEKEIYLSGGTNIAWLFVGFPAPPATSRDYVTMKVIHALMGEGLSSRLFTEIREKRSLAYELGAVYPLLRGPSHMLTYTITKPNQVGSARRQLLAEIERLKRDGVGQQELEESRRKVIGNYLLERETNHGKAFNLALAEVVGLGADFDLNFVRAVEAVTAKDVKDVAGRYLDNYTLVVARPGGRFYFDY